MLRDPVPSRTVEPTNGVSRRVFLQAAAAGSGLMLSLRLPIRTWSRGAQTQALVERVAMSALCQKTDSCTAAIDVSC